MISSASGSSYFECGSTKIACAVYGPKQVKNAPYSSNGKLNVEIKYSPFASTIRRDPMKELEASHLSSQVTQSLLPSLRLENYEKMQIDLFITILQDDSLDFGLLGAITTASGTALANAGIEMNGLVIGLAIALKDGNFLLDPSPNECSDCDAIMTVCTLPALTQCTSIWQAGKLNIKDYIECLKIVESASRNVHTVVAKSLVQETTS